MNTEETSIKEFKPNYSLYSWALIALFTLFQAIRWNHLPQFIDDYYHLLVAQNFVKAGGWVGWDFFEYAPLGRPHLYPPLYHVILAFFLERGVDGLQLIKITEVVIVPLFFIVLFYTCREVFSSLFAFLTVLICGSYFHFFVALTSNIPATLGMILGLVLLVGLKRLDVILASMGLILCFYAHSGIALIFMITVLICVFLQPRIRRFLFTVLGASLLCALPLIWHQCRYLAYIQPDILAEQRFVHINIAILGIGIIGLFVIIRKRREYSIILAFILASLIVFFKYFYRYFAAQGFLGLALSASACIEYMTQKPRSRLIIYTLFTGICLFIFLASSTFTLDDSKTSWKAVDSTFSNYAQGRSFQTLPFTSVFSPKYFPDMLRAIRNHSSESAIIGSNIKVVSIIAASLTGRFTADALFYEVKPLKRQRVIESSDIFIWVKSETDISLSERRLIHDIRQSQMSKLFENELVTVFKSSHASSSPRITRSQFPLLLIYLLMGSSCGLIIWRMFYHV